MGFTLFQRPANLQTTVYEALLTIHHTSMEAEKAFNTCGPVAYAENIHRGLH